MLYLIGLGLNAESISMRGLSAVKKCKKVYLENYTVNFPYSINELSSVIEKKIAPANREFVESFKIIDEAKKTDVALLIYGSPLTATTHISLIHEAEESGIKCEIVYNASILDAVAETGLQLYKFGKISSMPKWDKEKNFTPDSFMEIVKNNLSIKAHSLILIDINLEFQDALKQLKISAEKYGVNASKLVICQALGTKKGKILYKNFQDLEDFHGVKCPYCIIIPSTLHFIEKEILNNYS